MTKNNASQEWFKQAWYDYETAKAMFESKRYMYAAFMCHMSLEKALKGYVLKTTEKFPPKTHDLLYLITLGRLQFTHDTLSFIQVLNTMHIRTRYPDNLDRLLAEYTPETTHTILARSEEILRWIENRSQD